jgi:ATP-dependent RNA helicase SUPV3L1/SUV3
VELYKKGKTDIVVATDAIGMGLNLPIKRILFAEDEKFDGICRRQLTPSEVKQIAGRAGRKGIYDEGHVSVFTDYVFYDSTDMEFIEKMLNTKNKEIENILIPFPEEILNEKYKVSEIMDLWLDVKYPSIYKHCDISEYIVNARYIEKKFDKYGFSVEEIYRLATIPFDSKLEELQELWLWYIQKYVKNDPLSMPVLHGFDLYSLELYAKKLDLYYSFSKTVGLAIDEEEFARRKEECVNKINKELDRILKKQRSKKKKAI